MAEVDSQRSKEVLERVERERGVRAWPKLLAARDPDMLELMHDTTTYVLDRRNSVPRKYKEIILACLNAASLREFGFRFHVRGALAHDASEDEILEALELVGLTNQQALTSMLAPLADEVAKARENGSVG
ncbi:carboxymuconolactone decarboxylase family protein [Nocardia sp. CA2R105]|uniref:carboxymuconolactone decarboxylase family protein n=1 Tax=Nocardia coffeae TaxID=2873381 RepID=UPI001CA6ADBC|nr:carboxymuconolactone decarboxylase family protein [Nocardia coffeae]MBY8858678.1 carboxymuconolactone decarboxylase family protein [Nocardia coffeae]